VPDSCWLTSSTAYQLISKKGLPSGPAVRMVVSAGRLFPWQAWYFARASALHEWMAFISGNTGMTFDLIKEDAGSRVPESIRKNFEEFSLDMVTVLLWVQQLFPYLMEWGKAVCGIMNMIVSDSSSCSCQFCSPYGVGFTSSIWFNQVRVAWAGVVDPCPNMCFAFLDMEATIRVGSGFSVRNFKCESWFAMMGKGATSPKAGLWEHLVVLSQWSFLNFLRPGAVLACLALHIWWLEMLLGYQFASGMSRARLCSHWHGM